MALVAATIAIALQSTAYCQSGRMADGTRTRAGSVASNRYPLGTHITVTPRFRHRARFTVRDRIGHGSQLDFYTPSCRHALHWGRRTVKVRRGWHHHAKKLDSLPFRQASVSQRAPSRRRRRPCRSSVSRRTPDPPACSTVATAGARRRHR